MILFGKKPDSYIDTGESHYIYWDRQRRKLVIKQFGPTMSGIALDMWRPGLFMLGVRAIWASIWPWGK